MNAIKAKQWTRVATIDSEVGRRVRVGGGDGIDGGMVDGGKIMMVVVVMMSICDDESSSSSASRSNSNSSSGNGDSYLHSDCVGVWW